jgi:predicted Zn-dependent protease
MIRTFLTFFFFCLPYGLQASTAVNTIPEGHSIEDDEIESALTDWLQQIFTVAHITIAPKVYLLVSPEINAGATYGGQIVVYTGLIQKCKHVGQLIGVLAHESGHIAGSHLAKQAMAQDQATAPAIASALLGGALGILAGNPAPLLAGTAGGLQLLERSLLKHSRDDEDAADSAAMQYLEKLRWPAEGLYEFLNILNQKFSGYQDPYTSTHPLTETRMGKIRSYKNPDTTKSTYSLPSDFAERFNRIKAKIIGFMETPMNVNAAYPETDKSLPAQYARAIAAYRARNFKGALDLLDAMLVATPDDAYFLELKGQILVEDRRPQEAIPCFEKALAKRPTSFNMGVLFAHTVIETGKKEDYPKAIQWLNKAIEKNKQNAYAWRLLARAHGEGPEATLCLAEEAWAMNDVKRANAIAKKIEHAKDPIISKRAQDIMAQAKLAEHK